MESAAAVVTATTPGYSESNHPSAIHGTTGPVPQGGPTPRLDEQRSSATGSSSATAARVAALVAEDPHLTTAAIAHRLGISERTARRHRAVARRALEEPGDAVSGETASDQRDDRSTPALSGRQEGDAA